VYSSSWIKLHYPAEFACALLNAQPMGFYSPHTIVRDAIRHGVEVLGPDVNASRKDCTLEPRTAEAGPVGQPTTQVLGQVGATVDRVLPTDRRPSVARAVDRVGATLSQLKLP